MLHLSGTHLTSFVTATPLSLIQASNGQVYILQNQQQLPHHPQHQQITGCCHPSGNPHFATSNSTTQGAGVATGTTQFFPTQMILAANSAQTASSGDNCNINSQLILATTTTNKLTSCLSTSNWLPTTASPAIHGESKFLLKKCNFRELHPKLKSFQNSPQQNRRHSKLLRDFLKIILKCIF